MADARDVADAVATKARRSGQRARKLLYQIADVACAFLPSVATTICAALESIANEVCRVSRTVCDATTRIPMAGHVVGWVSRAVSEVVCLSSHIVGATLCVATHLLTKAVGISIRVIVMSVGVLVGGGVEIAGIFLGLVTELTWLFTAAPRTAMRPAMPPGDTDINPRVNGDEVVPLLAKDIRAAQHNIHVSMFLFFNDPMGQWLADQLIARASDKKHAIDVRVMFDFARTRLGDPFSSSAKAAVIKDPNYHDDPVDVDAIARRLRGGGVRVLKTDIDYDAIVSTRDNTYRKEARAIRRALTIDFEVTDHRKIITIDDHVGYLGSANVGCQYLYRNALAPGTAAADEVALELTKPAGRGPEPWLKWHDSLTRVDGPVAYVLEQYFRRRWVLNGGDEYCLRPPQFTAPTAPPTSQVFVATPGFRNEIKKQYVRHIREATKSIFIENSYCYHPQIITALIRAKRKNRNLSIRMILPSAGYNDNPLCQDAQEYRYEALLKAGIDLYEYVNHFTHMKVATFDSVWSIVGSANLNYRSMEWDRDFEVVLISSDPEIAERLERSVETADLTGACQPVALGSLQWSHRHRSPATVAAEIARAL